MPANNKKMEIYVLETVNRLHLIQVDFADESEQTRMDYLCEEIERALKMVLPEERNEFLQRLQERFPIGNIATLPMLKEREDEDISVTDKTQLQDIDFLVHSLLEIFPTLPDEKKESIAGRLQQMAKGGEIIIGEQTYAQIKDRILIEKKHEIKVKNKTEPVICYKMKR